MSDELGRGWVEDEMRNEEDMGVVDVMSRSSSS